MDIKLPELGEGIESGDVISVLVSEGDTVEKDQGLVELETDKASVEIPSTHAGKVSKVHVSEGQTLKVGSPIVSLETSAAGQEESAPPPSEPEQEQQAKAEPPAAEEQPASQQPASEEAPAEQPAAEQSPAEPAPAQEQADQEPARAPQESPAKSQPTRQSPPQPMQAHAEQRDASRATAAAQAAHAHQTSEESGGNGDIIPAGPAMRRFAREVGVDLQHVEGTGPGGRITRGDILRVVREGTKSAGAPSGAAATQTAPPPQPATAAPASAEPAQAAPAPPDGEQARDDWGPIRVAKMPKIRQTIANKMHESWTTIPRVTNFDDADVTELEQVRQASKADYAAAGIKLTQMPFVIKACAMALRANPVINASVDLQNGQIIYKEYVNIGIAVDTERGLIVPSLRNADRLAIPDIARALDTLASNVRNGSFGVEDLRGSTFTISNLGAIGGTYSTPIINPPEVAILLLGRSRKMPVVADHQFAMRLQMPLSLSYDHRLVDGAAAARFLNDVKSFLQSPSRLLLAP